ncbi:hypothetical protein E3E35_06840 [Thermococcus sp. GR7]|uniref:hypothetical protein n=1 Tax=unclassified Thermococcus TaxID=2627626 RepID=UPI00143126F5|nr:MULTISPECIES: hypothetical protein [unclassified Thermococcus]NJE47121.1 hypothetical protein [Thermococcus sp. GR7]NJE78054.1 hypothetical protein [Thermococcus sp. GR4]NJF22829.1 hypothetical protein [Thermococcus sp. GR5]
MAKKIWIALWLFINLLIFWSVGLYTSGYSLEGYLPWESAKIQEYTPIIHTFPGDEPYGILYMVDIKGNIYYYIVWEDEYFHNTIIDRLYHFFRSLVYNGNTYDIEAVKIYPDNNSVYLQTYEHTDVWATIQPDESCLWNGQTIPDCTEKGTHVKVYVVTWNHMLSLTPENGTIRVENLPMRQMTVDDYVSLGMFRRTQKTIGGVTVNSLLIAVLITVLFNVTLYAGWKRGYLSMEYYRKLKEEIHKDLKRIRK